MSPLLTWRDDVTFVVDAFTAVGILVYFAFLVRNSRRSVATLQLLLSRVVQPDADMSEDSRAALDQGRLRAFRAFNSLTVAGIALALLGTLPRRLASPHEFNHLTILPWLFASISFEIFPRMLTVRRYEILFIVTASVAACERLIGVNNLPTAEMTHVMFRIATGMIMCNPRLVLGMNAAITVGNLFSHLVYSPHPMYGTIGWATQILVSMAATALSYSTHFCAVRSASLQAELQAAIKAQAPLRSLLARWCDATVELGSDLRMRQHSVNLAVLLFRPSCRLQGTLFEDILHRADRLRFAQVLASCTAMEGTATHASPAQVVQVALLDGNGNAVPVQLVHTCVRDDNADYCHFIGIREEDAEFHAAPPPPVADQALTHQSWEQAIRTAGAPDVEARVIGAGSDDGTQPLGTITSGPRSLASASDVEARVIGAGPDDGSQPLGILTSGPRSLASAVSSSGGSSGSNCTLRNFADVHVAVDVSTDNLEIVDASETFIELGGPQTIGSSFRTWVKDGKRLAKWLQTSANSLVYGEEELPEYFGSLRLKTPIATCRAAGVAVDVEDFYLHAAAVPEDERASVRLRLVFSGVQAACHGGYRFGSNRRHSRTGTAL